MSGIVAYYKRTSHYTQQMSIQDSIVPSSNENYRIYEDKGVSGRVMFQDRPAGKKLLQDIKQGNIIKEIKVHSFSRLGRDVTDILNSVKFCHDHGVKITSKTEGLTTLDENGKQTPMTGLLINLLSSLAEFQYHQIREKTLEGIERAKVLGKYKGRKPNSTEPIEKFKNKPKVKKITEMLELGVGIRKISRLLECSTAYVYKVKRICLSGD